MVLSYLPGASLVPPRLSKWSFPASLVPPKLPNLLFPASLVPPWCLAVSNWSFPASLVPPWCLAGCPISPFLLHWYLPGCPIAFLPCWCLPGASQAVQLVLSCLPGASLHSKWLSRASQAFHMPLSSLPGLSHGLSMTPGFFPGKQTPALPWQITGVIRSLWPPGTSRAVQMVFQWRLAVPRVSKIKPGLGRLPESVGLALADYWSHPVVGI